MIERSECRGAGNLLAWRKSSASGSESCYEIAFSGRAVLVRDSKNRSGATLEFDRHDWAEFLRRVSR
jgi:hypothetical protein